MEARAIHRYIASSPRKMRLVIDLIRGKSATEALHLLHFSPKHASKVAEKVLRSAISNLQNKDEGGRIEPDDIVVTAASVDAGAVMKRISPAPMGRAYRIRKRSNHVTIVVAPKAKPAVRAAKPKSSARAGGKAPKGTAAPAPKSAKKTSARGAKKSAPPAQQ